MHIVLSLTFFEQQRSFDGYIFVVVTYPQHVYFYIPEALWDSN